MCIHSAKNSKLHRLLLIWNTIYCHNFSWSKILKFFVITVYLIWWIILWSILITEKERQHVRFLTYNSTVETVSKVIPEQSIHSQHDVLNHEKCVGRRFAMVCHSTDSSISLLKIIHFWLWAILCDSPWLLT